MKTRVKFYGGSYYPEVKRWGFWWHTYCGDNIMHFGNKADAVAWAQTELLYNNKVVWESE